MSRISPLWLIVLVWVAGNLLLLGLQAFGAGVGLDVHPLGEDRIWTRLMAGYPGLELHRQFWTTVESRNPLASWWYQAFSPLIFLLPEGLYLVRKGVDLFLAASVYLLVDQISRARLPKFAFACGVLVLFWNFSGYVEQIMWIMLISFGLSILSVYSYCRYLDSDRATADYLVISLLLFLVALATYTIQCGVPIAVFILALFRRSETGGDWRLSSAIRGAIKDSAFFGVLLVLFIQVWITTSRDMGGFFDLDPALFPKRLLTSITNFIWHYDTSYLIRSLFRHWPLWLLVVSVGLGAILFYCLFAAIEKKEAVPSTAVLSVPQLDLVLVPAVFCALIAPTVLLESTTAIWYSGSRSRMVLQGFQPAVYLSILFLLTEYAFRRTGRGVEYVRDAGVALLCALAVVVGLEYNRRLSEQTMFEHKFETGLKQIVPAPEKPTHFVVKMKGMRRGVWYSGVSVSMPSFFARAAYNSNSVWLDPVYEGEPNRRDTEFSLFKRKNFRALKPVIFGNEQQGIYSPESGGWVPYRDAVFLEFDGQKVTRLMNIDRDTFSGYWAIYARDKPLGVEF